MQEKRPRRGPRSWQFLIVATLFLAVAVAAASSVERADGTPEKGCGAGQVAVTVDGHAGCRPTQTVLPKPKAAADPTLSALRDTLRNSPFTRFGSAGKQAQTRIAAA